MGYLAAVGTGFLLGSVPWALVLGRLLHRVDIRTKGSGNLGATNAFRVLGAATGTAVLLLDAGKGLAGALLSPAVAAAAGAAALSGPPAAAVPGAAGERELLSLVGGLAAVLGHVFSPWVRFRGGKGVATAAGAFGALAPPATLAAIGLWLATVAVTRWVSLGSILAAVGLLAILVATRGWSHPLAWAAAAVAALVLVRHAGNLRRIAAGTERRVSLGGRRGGSAA